VAEFGATDLLIIVPSRGRPAAVEQVARAWRDTRAFCRAVLEFALDRDDPEYGAYQDALARVRADQPEAGLLDVTFDRWLPMVHKLNAAAAAAVAGPRPPMAVGFAGDDHRPRTHGWAGRHLAELARLGTGIVYGNDLHRGAELPTQWAMTVDIVATLGRMVPAPVEHQFCDRSVLDLGRALDRIRYLPDVIIEHMHPAAGKAEMDSGYEAVNCKAQFLADQARYERWQDGGLLDDLFAVRQVAR
jgi:hypothetical protein